MNSQRNSKFQAILIAGLIVFSMLGTSAMAPFVPSRSQVKPATTNKLLQFTSSGHALGFTSQGMYAADGNHALHVDFVNANNVQPQSNTPIGEDGKASPLSQVTYANLWDGITLTYAALPGGIYTTTYILAPGAGAKNIHLLYNAPLTLNSDGSLGITFETGRMTESAPVAWQVIHGSRVPVEVTFNVQGQEVAFVLGAYDPRFVLTIDPSLVWNTFLGGSGGESGNDITLDSKGNIYIIGDSTDTWGSPVRVFTGGLTDAFVAKLDSYGNLIWNTFLGGNGEDRGSQIAMDTSGTVYVTGFSTNNWSCSPVSCSVRDFTTGKDTFAAKLDSSGNLIWNTFLGTKDASPSSWGEDIAVDISGNVYVTGGSNAAWGCLSVSCTIRAYTTNTGAFAAKMDSSGNLLWNTFLGGSQYDFGYGIAVDNSGNIHVTGLSNAAWGCSPVPCTVQAYTYGDAFVAKLDSSGNLIWNTFLGGSGGDGAFDIAMDGIGNIYVTGESTATWGSPLRPFSGNIDAFVAKLNSSGSLVWNTFLGSGDDEGFGIAADSSGNVYITGSSYASWGCSPTSCTLRAYSDNGDAFAAKLDSSGSLVWNAFLGGSMYDNSSGIAVDGSGNTFVAGVSDANWGSPVHAYNNSDAFVAKIDGTMVGGIISGNLGVSGVQMSYTDGIVKTVISQADGSYSFPVSSNWSGTVTPSHPCYTFNPLSINYSNVLTDQTAQDYTPTINPGCANINVSIAGNNQGTYGLPQGSVTRQNYAGLDSGPLKVTSTNSMNIIAAERDAWAVNGAPTSFAQLMGLPASQLSDTYVFPAYNNVTLNEQLRIGNVGTVPTTVTVTIGGVLRGTYPLAAGQAVRVNYADVDSGPVIVQGTAGVHIIAAERDAWSANGTTTSFVQLMGLPSSQLSDTYVFPAYNNVTLNEQLRIANVDSVPTTVTVTIGGILQGTYPLAANGSVRVNYAGLDSGPVIVQGTPGVHIIAALRDAWAAKGTTTSFAQLMGLPGGQLSDTYEFPSYNNVTLNEQLRIANVDTVPSTVTVTIGGVLRGTYPLAAHETVRVNYAGLDSGPVVIQGTSGVHIIAAERDALAANGVITSFTQLMGLPFGQLSDTYLFPAYNNVTLNEQLRFGVP